MRMPRSGLLAGCALGALLATLPAVAEAQSFTGTPTVVAGDASISTNPGGIGIPASTDIFVLQPETVINWDVTTSGPSFTFQPAGTVATFEGDDLSDFTVLNRILPFDFNGGALASTAIINGTVESYVNPIGGSRDIGGQVWFYSPTGIIAGPNSLFNVGSLILTTNDIQFVAAAGSDPGSIYGPGGTVQFRGLKDSTGLVEIQSGAQINALGNLTGSDAYVALVAPRVVQNGFVAADGNIAYIAAEEVDMTINGGLFDFVVNTGTTDADGIVHTGVTTGPESTDGFDVQRIMMVAVPKNDALTMLLSGTIGYSPAALAFNEGSSVVLAAGFGTPDPATMPSGIDASIDIGNTTFTNTLTAWATNGINVAPVGGTVRFGGDAFLNAGEFIDVTATEREFVIGDGSLSLKSGIPSSGGDITVLAETADFLPGGVIDIAGVFNIDASSDGILGIPGPPVDGFGGTVVITADGGLIAAPNLFVSAYGNGNFDGTQGGLGQGGQIDVRVTGLGTIRSDFVELSAGGFGGGSDDQGGDGIGGDVTLSDLDGTLDFGSVFVRANGGGGAAASNAGAGRGGTATVSISSQTQSWDELFIDTSGNAGGPAVESSGRSGSASGGQTGGSILRVTGKGGLTLGGDLVLTSNAYMLTDGGTGFAGDGGGVEITVDSGTLNVGGTIYTHASALFDTEFVDTSIPANSSPTQTGGDVAITATGGGRITAGNLDAHAEAVGLSGLVAAGSATGGNVTVSALSGGSIRLDDDGGGSLARISADAFGSPGPIASDATGGTARIVLDDGEFSVVGDIDLSASGLIGEFFAPPPEGFGFNATGGTASVELLAGTLGTTNLVAEDLDITAVGDGRLILTVGTLGPGGEPIQGDGGDGTGGTARLTMAAGTFMVDNLTLDSSGIGGGSGPSSESFAFASGDGFGATTEFGLSGGVANVTGLNLISNGTGGDGTGGPAAGGSELASLAGNGTGGSVTLQLDGGELRVTDATLEANGFGGPGMGHLNDGLASDGGIGTGGTAALRSAVGWTGSFTTTTLDVHANGEGGEGGFSEPPSEPPAFGSSGDGGAGIGGDATIELFDGEFSLGSVEIGALGSGGDSGDAGSGLDGAEGGDGIGGFARFALVDTVGPAGARSLDDLLIDSSGFGGVGSSFAGSSGVRGAELTVSVLDAASALDLPGSVSIFANGGNLAVTSGIQALITGAPLEVGGDITMGAAGPVIVVAEQPLIADGFVDIEGLLFSSSGLIQSGDTMSIRSIFNLNAERLIAGQSANLESEFGDIATGDVTAGIWIYADAFGSATLDNLVAGTDAAVTTRGGDLSVADVTAGDDIWLSVFGSDPNATLTAGELVSTGLGDDSADGPPELFGGPGPAGNVTRVRSAGSLSIGELITPGRAILVADQGTMTLGDLTGDEALILLGRGDITLDSATTGGAFYVADSAMFLPNLPDAYDPASLTGLDPIGMAGSLTALGPIQAGSTSIAADGGIALPMLQTGGNPFLQATNGTIVIPELLTFGRVTVRAQDIQLGSSGSLFLGEATATAGDVNAYAAGELVTIAITASGDVILTSTGDYLRSLGDVTGTNVQLSAFGDVRAEAGDLLAENDLAIDAGGTFLLNGLARGTTISAVSSDIDLGVEAQVGSRGVTQSIELVNGDPSNETYIGQGEVVEEPTYVLDGDEARRLFADESIFLGVRSSGEGGTADVDVGDLQMSFGGTGNIGTGGTLEISSPGEIHITGDVELTASSADDTFRIDPRLIALHTDTGSISMFSGEGVNANGRIELVADTVVAATDNVIDQLDTMTDLDAITELLGQPGGTGDTIAAAAIDISVVDGLYIQNSGASDQYADRRGFAAGALNIETESDDTQIAINGQILRPVTLGGPVTGLDVTPLVSINGEPAAAGGQFDPRSSINGCVIGTDCGFVPEPEPELRPVDPPSDDDLNPVDPVDPPGGFIVAPLIELAGTEPLIDPPLVDEPITGVGNDDLWQPPCDDPDEDGACPEDGEQQ